MKIPAFLVLRVIAAAQAGIGLAAVYLGLLRPQIVSPWWWLGLAAVVFVIGERGPDRILAKKLKLPLEITRAIRVQSGLLSFAGVALVAEGLTRAESGLTMLSWLTKLAGMPLALAGVAAVVAAWRGFYTLSTRLPPTFYIDEMLSIIQTAGIAGKTEDSAADQAFRRWSEGSEGAEVGKPAPSGVMVTLDGEPTSLATVFALDDRPVVVNLGSYSCPHHRKRLPELEALMKKHGDRVRYLTIYIAEAHPDDGWKLPKQYENDAEFTDESEFCFLYAKTLDDRLAMAQRLVDAKNFSMEVVVDAMDNHLLHAYNAWPIRLYVVTGGELVFAGRQGPFGYDVDEVDAFLTQLR